MNELNQLNELTEKLIKASDYLLQTFNKVKESGKQEDFYDLVRPYANEIKQLNDRWKLLAKDWIQKNKPLYLNAIQIDSASDHLEVISIQAFFPQTSKKRFLDSHKSVIYILHALQEELTRGA